MIAKNVMAIAASALAALSVASAATRVEPLQVKIMEGDGAGTTMLGSMTFDDANLQIDQDGGFTVDSANNALTIEFPLLMGVVATEGDDFEFPQFPRATFDGEGDLVDLEFLVLNTDLYVEVLEDLTFFFEIGPVNAPLAAGSGEVRGGVSAVPVPAAALLFAPLAGAFFGRRFITAR